MSSRIGLLSTVVVCCLLGGKAQSAAEESIEDRVGKLCAVAKAAAQERDFARVERLRVERQQLLKTDGSDSAWVRGHHAIRTAGELIDRLEYARACAVLRDAWKPFAEKAEGPVYGDIAMKFFEATQAARVIYPQCLEDGHRSQIATESEIRELIRMAVERDPCVVEAQAVQAFLTRPDPQEAFSRAEVRPSLQARNRMLLNISYEGQGPIFPWHAPVEMCKAENFAAILDDVDFCRNVLYRGVVNQIAGWDARYEPFELLGESLLLMRLPNKKAYDTPSLVYLVPNRRKPEWKKIDMRLLVLDTDAQDSQSKPESQEEFKQRLRRVLSSAEPLFEQRLGKTRLRVFDVPVDCAEDAVHALQWIGLENFGILEKAINDAKTTLSTNPNVPTSRLGFSPDDIWESATGAQISYWRGKVYYDVSSIASQGALLILANETKTAVTPPLFVSSSSHPYLQLKDGHKLVFNSHDRRMEIAYPSATAYITFDPKSVPPAFALATEHGKKIEEFLAKAGYSGEGEAAKELMKVLANNRYKPAKLTGKPIGDDVHKSVRELRYDVTGFRYLEDTRGRLLVSRESLGERAAASATPYRVFTKEGTELQDTDTQYKAEDYQSLYTNVVCNFLPRALWLAPIAPLWGRLESELYRLPPPGNGLNWAAHQSLGQHLQAPWAKEPVNPAAAPAPWTDEPSQSDIADAIRPEFWKLNCDAYKPTPGQATLLTRRDGVLTAEQIPHVVLGAAGGQSSHGSQSANPERVAWDRLVAIYHKQAITDALAGRFHRSIIGYQDVLQKLNADELNLQFFQKIPDEKKLQEFAGKFIAYVESQEKNIIARAELASVLRSGGLAASAEFLERGLLDQFHLSTLPVIEAANAYAVSYGYKEPLQIAVTRQRIESHVQSIENSAKHDSSGHIIRAFRSKTFDGKAAAKRQELVALFEQVANADGEDAKAKEAAIRATYADLQQMPRALTDWLEEKKVLQKKRPQWVVEQGRFPQPNVVCPCEEFNEKERFAAPLNPLVDGINAKEITAWALSEDAVREKDDDSGRFNFLLGWYWLERNNGARARTAFVAAARAYAMLGAKDDSMASMVARRNAVLLLIAAAGIRDMPPGVNVSHTQYVNELSLQLLMWKRQWVALGYPAVESEQEYERLCNVIGVVQSLDKDAVAGDDTHRYFFFDYRFEQGPVPDVLVDAYHERVMAASDARRLEKAKDGPAAPAVAMPVWAEVIQEFQFPTTIDEKVLALKPLPKE